MVKRTINIIRIKHGHIMSSVQDVVLAEQAITLFVNSQPVSEIICMSNDLKELAAGFLFSRSIINSIKDIKTLKIDESNQSIRVELIDSMEFNPDLLNMNPASRVCDKKSGNTSYWDNLSDNTPGKLQFSNGGKDNIRIDTETIFSCINVLQNNTHLFNETGGCHGAALFDFKGLLLSTKEDIGRHNSIDKVIGDALLRTIDLKHCILGSTGRLTGDTVLKAVTAQIPCVVSVAAAIDSGIRLADQFGITLIGFVRNGRMNIYSNPSRIQTCLLDMTQQIQNKSHEMASNITG